MSLEELQQRFAEEIKQRALAHQYIDRAQERDLLQIAREQGIAADSARAALVPVCEAQGCVLESRVVGLLRDYLDTAAGNDGKIDEKEYRDALTLCRKWTQGKCAEGQCQRLIVAIIQDNAYATSRGWFGSWYDRVKKEAGLEAPR